MENKKLRISIKKKLRDFTLQVDFDTKEGCLGIMGPSGNGKSMVLKCIAGIETPDEGLIQYGDKVFFDSRRHINLRPQERGVGYLFQSYALFPNMNVENNILCGVKHKKDGKRRTRKERKDKVFELLETFQMESIAKSYPAQLSGGQKQRVALARMIASEPEVILLDEPVSALDIDLRKEVLAEIELFQKKYKVTSIMVSHEMEEINQICSSYKNIRNGKFEICST